MMRMGYLPSSEERISIICERTDECPIWHYGIETNDKQLYNSDRLMEVRTQLGVAKNRRSIRKVRIKRPLEIKHIWVLDPMAREYFEVPNTRLDYAGDMTIHEHRAARKIARKKFRESPQYERMLRAKEYLRSTGEQLLRDGKILARKNEAKRRGERSKPHVSPKTTPSNRAEGKVEKPPSLRTPKLPKFPQRQVQSQPQGEAFDAYDVFPNPLVRRVIGDHSSGGSGARGGPTGGGT